MKSEQVRAIGIDKLMREVKEQVKELDKLKPSETRGDLMRRLRASIELLPAYSPRDSKNYDPEFP